MLGLSSCGFSQYRLRVFPEERFEYAIPVSFFIATEDDLKKLEGVTVRKWFDETTMTDIGDLLQGEERDRLTTLDAQDNYKMSKKLVGPFESTPVRVYVWAALRSRNGGAATLDLKTMGGFLKLFPSDRVACIDVHVYHDRIEVKKGKNP
ncbi:MAG: hypothetical protein GY946_24300 [bacterium]|nr:hypothetical protein [bacterium]